MHIYLFALSLDRAFWQAGLHSNSLLFGLIRAPVTFLLRPSYRCVCVCVRACACVCACMRACVSLTVRAAVNSSYGSNIM